MGSHSGGEHSVVVSIAIRHAKHAWCSIEDACPIARRHLFGRGLIGIISGSRLRISVGSLVHLVLHARDDVVLAKVHVHLVGDDERFRL